MLIHSQTYFCACTVFQVNFVSTEMEVFENETRVRVCLEHNRNCMEEFTVQVGNSPHSNRNTSASKGHIYYDVILCVHIIFSTSRLKIPQHCIIRTVHRYVCNHTKYYNPIHNLNNAI